MKTLRLIFADHLTHLDGDDPVLMVEVPDAWDHQKKMAFQLAAMRHFYEEIKGPKDYLDVEKWKGSLVDTLEAYLKKHSYDKITVLDPSSWQIEQDLRQLSVPVEVVPDPRFFCSRDQFADWAKGKKKLVMEFFYRMMRKEEDILLEPDGSPSGGQWNFDKENRKPLKEKRKMPPPMQFKPDTTTKEVLKLVEKQFGDHFGKLTPFWFAVTAAQARKALSHFMEHAFASFGDYQDAMVEGEYYLYHSALSQYLNAGLLTAREIVEAALESEAPINAKEGFIRQILGWREFIRGIYWTHMPEYATRNALEAKRPLPDFYWTGDTDMNCMRCVIKQTEAEAHSHHIQRLMVTGNFALIAGIVPEEVCKWYLAVYADAYEWVELPNTLGMALFGDGGVVGTKPYAASGSYINRMSNFCKSCKYDVRSKTSCPFNFLYWDFLLRHESTFRDNPRMKLVLSHIKKMSSEEKASIRKQAKAFLT